MEKALLDRIQRITYELECVTFLTEKQREELLKELYQLQKQLDTLRKVLYETEEDRFKE